MYLTQKINFPVLTLLGSVLIGYPLKASAGVEKNSDEYHSLFDLKKQEDQHYNDYRPEYFEQMKLPKNIKYPTLHNPIVTIIDSAVQPLESINAPYTYYHIHPSVIKKDLDSPNFIHGTAMAAIIGSRLYFDGKSYYKGILPGVTLINRIVIPSSGFPTSFYDAVVAAKDMKKESILNISGADVGTTNATQWNELLKGIGADNNILIIAAVGNDGRDINKLSPENQYWPAAYKPRVKENKENDPVIRVAALSFSEERPSLYRSHLSTGSRYASGRVDIGAPGFNIPYLDPNGLVRVGNGTSEATAIVSGVVAIMRSCSKDMTAKFIKKTLLDTSDKYEHLKEYITEGRVLNAGKAIASACNIYNEMEKGENKEFKLIEDHETFNESREKGIKNFHDELK